MLTLSENREADNNDGGPRAPAHSLSPESLNRFYDRVQPTVKTGPKEPDDHDLLQRVGQGDLDAFAALYDRFSGLLYSLAFRILNDNREAEDVLQDTLLQIWQKADGYDPALGQPHSWMVTLARNKAIDRLRSRRRYGDLTRKFLDELAETHSTSTASLNTVFSRERIELIQNAMNLLPAEQRQAIDLAFFVGLTQTEIAGALQTPLGTIKARIRRGMLQLRTTLESES